MQKKSKEFFKLFMDQGEEIEHDFVDMKMKKNMSKYNEAPKSDNGNMNSGIFNQIEDY